MTDTACGGGKFWWEDDPGQENTKRRPSRKFRKLIRIDQKCVYCNSNAQVIDHFIPSSKISDYSLTRKQINHYSNLVAACRTCDREKGSQKPEEFFQRFPEYRENFLRNYSSRPVEYQSDRILAAAGFMSLLQLVSHR